MAASAQRTADAAAASATGTTTKQPPPSLPSVTDAAFAAMCNSNHYHHQQQQYQHCTSSTSSSSIPSSSSSVNLEQIKLQKEGVEKKNKKKKEEGEKEEATLAATQQQFTSYSHSSQPPFLPPPVQFHNAQQPNKLMLEFQMPQMSVLMPPAPMSQPIVGQQAEVPSAQQNNNDGINNDNQEQTAPHFMVFEFGAGRVSGFKTTSTPNWPSQKWQNAQQQQSQRNVLFAPKAGQNDGQQEGDNKAAADGNAFICCPTSNQQQQPFRPIGQSAMFLPHQQAAARKPSLLPPHNGGGEAPVEQPNVQQQIRFTMVQMDGGWPHRHHHSHHHRNSNSSLFSTNISRLFFDNPMFRRLPNWHFFGDDRRLAPIPRLIPMLPVPVERTLLSIAPSPVWVRQLLLLGILNVESGGMDGDGGICCTFGQAAIDYESESAEQQQQQQEQQASSSTQVEWSEADEEEEEEIPLPCLSDGTELLLPLLAPDSSAGGCPSSSGIESMSSSCSDGHDDSTETVTTTPTGSRCSCTPVRAMSVLSDDEDGGDSGEMEEGIRGGRGGKEKHLPNGNNNDDNNDKIDCATSNNNNNNGSSSTSNSNASSTPNSPPSFDRRTVRMSRTKRDEVLRLSISRHYGGDDVGDTVNSLGNGNTSCSSDFYQISCMDVLSEHIFNFKQNTEQSTVELNKKLILRDQLYYAISPIFPMCGLYIVGSSLNGFGTKHSDLDLCLMITNRDIDQRSDAVVILSSVMRTLENSSLVIEQQLILAKVPILRIKCTGAFEGIIVDLNVNNSVAIRNTHLMSYYSGFDWRVRPIVMVVKEWAKCRGINNASHSSFTSYSLVLMVIHYLQCGADPPVLPSLQKIYSNRFSEKTDVRLLNISQPLEPMPSAVWNFDQRLTLSDLLLGFLHYYAYDFNFDQDAISIRTGQKVNRAQVAQNQSPFNTLSQWHCICIEEPFTLSNAAHSIYDQRIFNYIKESFMKSYIELNKHRDLNQFLAKPTDEEKQRLVMALPQQIMMIPSEKIENGPINHTNCCL